MTNFTPLISELIKWIPFLSSSDLNDWNLVYNLSSFIIQHTNKIKTWIGDNPASIESHYSSSFDASTFNSTKKSTNICHLTCVVCAPDSFQGFLIVNPFFEKGFPETPRFLVWYYSNNKIEYHRRNFILWHYNGDSPQIFITPDLHIKTILNRPLDIIKCSLFSH